MSFIVSEPAKLDINDIYEYSILEFGWDRTVLYLMEMEEVFYSITQHHQLGTKRMYIANDVFAIPFQSHVIFYRINSDSQVVIVRILHGSRDIPKRFKE